MSLFSFTHACSLICASPGMDNACARNCPASIMMLVVLAFFDDDDDGGFAAVLHSYTISYHCNHNDNNDKF